MATALEHNHDLGAARARSRAVEIEAEGAGAALITGAVASTVLTLVVVPGIYFLVRRGGEDDPGEEVGTPGMDGEEDAPVPGETVRDPEPAVDRLLEVHDVTAFSRVSLEGHGKGQPVGWYGEVAP